MTAAAARSTAATATTGNVATSGTGLATGLATGNAGEGASTAPAGAAPVSAAPAGAAPAGTVGSVVAGPAAARYLAPGGFTRRVFNPLVAFLTRRGLSVWGSRVLRVRGRVSGEWRETPVNVLTHEGVRYLVAPRGTTQWVRNIRVSGGGELRVGRRTEAFTVTELADADPAKAEVLRAYLRRWKFEVGAFFEGVGPDSADAELAAAGPKHPVFRIG